MRIPEIVFKRPTLTDRGKETEWGAVKLDEGFAYDGLVLALAPLDGHHAGQRSASHAPLLGRSGEVRQSSHEPRLLCAEQRTCCVAQRIAIPTRFT